MTLFFGALLGLVSVALGAYAEHGLRDALSEEAFRSLLTAVRYNQIHAVVIVAVGLGARSRAAPWLSAALTWVAWGFTAGVVLFCFSIYLSVMLGVPGLTAATPLGGLLLMAAWLALAVIGLKAARSRDPSDDS